MENLNENKTEKINKDDYQLISENGKYNLMDKSGKLLSKFWIVKQNEKVNFADNSGEPLFEIWFDDIEVFSADYLGCFAFVHLNGKLNLVTNSGKLLSQIWFDDVNNFDDSVFVWLNSKGDSFSPLAKVQLGGKYNYLDTLGFLLSDTWFDDVTIVDAVDFYLKIDEEWHYIDTYIGDYLDKIGYYTPKFIPNDAPF